jgi:hypothetical protein
MMQQLSTTATAKLAKIGRTETADSADSLRDLLITRDRVPFGPVVETFLHFGGYTLPFPLEGRFKIYRLKDAIKRMTSNDKKSSDPQMFRMPFGESETIQSYFWINGLGHLYDDGTKMVDGIVEWIEDWSRNPSMSQWL